MTTARRYWPLLVAFLAVYLAVTMPIATDVITGKHEAWWASAVITTRPLLFWVTVIAVAEVSLFVRRRSAWLMIAGFVATAAFVAFWQMTYRLPVV